VPYSVSHNSGRDVDIALLYQDAKGKALDPPELIALNDEGVAKVRPYRFDAARAWVVVRALVTDPEVQVQYVFLAKPLKRLLIAQAASVREDPAVLRRAAAIVQQPVGAAPHNDHLHVRIYCSQLDVEGGCENSGVIHPWAKLFEKERKQRAEQVLGAVHDSNPEQRKRALERLVLLGPLKDAARLAPSLEDPVVEVRLTAASAIGALGDRKAVGPLVEAFRHEADLRVQLAILAAMPRLGGSQSVEFLVEVIGLGVPVAERGRGLLQAMLNPIPTLLRSGPTGYTTALQFGPAGEFLPVDWQPGLVPATPSQQVEALRLMAIDAAGRTERLEAVASLLPLLDEPSPAIRVRAAAALRLLTNRSWGVDWSKKLTAWHRGKKRAWEQWVADHRGQSRDVWLASGFVSAGYRVPQIHQQHLWEIVRAVAGPPHLSYNAERVLERLTNRKPETTDDSGVQRCHDWLRWLRRRRASLRLGPVPARLERLCG
jgi:hypothetical protein